ncbi:MAG: peptide-methionine (S)-S-oxide reductase MsrA [Bacteroidetes bacterium]|nr:peptide-methionine (S)-S-oxide reductase MsrA [Bacteroidota bacterium]
MNKDSTSAIGPTDTITFGGGCFWCTEAIYSAIKGVLKVEPGYSGGHSPNPTYKQVCSGATGHAEVIQVVFDPAQVSLKTLLGVFFKTHDPTTLNRQGADIGTQYRSIILHRSQQQQATAREVLNAIAEAHIYDSPIVTELKAFQVFYRAEDEHLNYFQRNPNQGYCQMVVQPKVQKFYTLFPELLKK